MLPDFFGVKRLPNSKRKTVDYFVGVENGKAVFNQNPMKADTFGFQSYANTLADVLAIADKKNKFESFKVSFS